MLIEQKAVALLVKDPANARAHNQKNIDAIKGSLTKFGQQKPIVINSLGVVIAGNGTLEAAKQLGWQSIDCVVTALDNLNQTAFALADNRTAELAEWDDDVLGPTLHQLRELDFDLTSIGFDTSYLDELLDDKTLNGDGAYTSKIETPVYMPTGEKPALSQLYDDTKTKQLIDDITNSKFSDAEKEFLKFAAYRHCVFNYEKIAEFYAHASADLQTAMEKSALVIIDFDKAIENGFVSMSEEIASAYSADDTGTDDE